MLLPRNSESRIPYWAYALLIIVLLVLVLYVIGRIHTPVDGIGFTKTGEQYIITTISPGSAAMEAGLLKGDIILKINNDNVVSNGYKILLEQHRAGDILNYLVLRGDERFSIQLELHSLWSQNKWFYLAFYSLVILVCTTSLYILYKKPYDRGAKLFFIFLQLFAIAQNHSILYLNTTYALFASIIFIFGFNLYGVVLLHFYLVFPVQVSFYKKIKRYISILYISGILFAVSLSAVLIWKYMQGNYSHFLTDGYSVGLLRWLGITLFLALLTAFYQFRHTRTVTLRKQLRFVLIGSAVGLIPPIVYSLFPEFVLRIQDEFNMLSTIELINGIGTYIMTSFLALAIFRYRMWNIQFIFRGALLYFVATLLIYFLYFTFVYLVQLLFHEENRLIQFIFLTASILIVMLLRDPIKRVVDKLFYLESYDTTATILAFEKQFASMYHFEALAAGISNFLNSVLHFSSFLFAIKDDSLKYKTVFATGIRENSSGGIINITQETERIIKESKVISIEELSDKPVQFDMARGEILVPLINGSDVFGFFVLGRKNTNKSYSLQDVKLLSLLSCRIVSLYQTAGLYQLDIDNQLMLERERTRIARDIHDDVGASLTRVSIMSELILNKEIKPKDLSKWLIQIAESCREVVSDMTQIIWTLSPQNDTLEGLMSYMRRYVSEYLEPTKISCSFHYPELLNDIAIRAVKRRNIFLCVREALNNIVKHSAAEKVWVRLIHEKDWIKITIKDNGKGFDQCILKESGNGLLNIKKRMKSIGGKTRITSNAKNGTEVLLFIPQPS
jgi:signal transduction histidine kinase